METTMNDTGQSLFDQILGFAIHGERNGLRFLREVRKRFSHRTKKYDKIRRALKVAAYEFRDIKRKSGAPYTDHLIAVALIIMLHEGVGYRTIVAAILHDIIEDTHYDFWKVWKEFGFVVAVLVWFVSRNEERSMWWFWTKLLFAPRAARLIKIADRVHNLLTLWHMNDRQQYQKLYESRIFYLWLSKEKRVLGLRVRSELLHEPLLHAIDSAQGMMHWRDMVKNGA